MSFTPVQRRILEILSDGLPHTRFELHKCLNDELSPVRNIRPHLTAIRKKIRPHGEDILCEYIPHGTYYRHVRLLASAYDGKR